jgi:hypothetical protein
MKPTVVLAALLLSGCSSTPVINAPSSSCVTLVPAEWRAGVPGAPLPDGDTVGDWIAFGDAQTGKLDQANGRTRDTIGIVERCEARDREAVRRAGRGWLGRLFN